MTELAGKILGTVRRVAFTPIKALCNRIDPPVIVLLYHRVATLPADPELLAVTPDNFRSHLRHLTARFPLVRFEADWSRIRQPSVCITFDDGYADNFRQALPILEEFQVPATFFVSSGPVAASGEFWWDELHRIVVREEGLPDLFTLPGTERSWPSRTPAQRERLYAELVPLLVATETGRRAELLEALRRWAHAPEGPEERNRPLTVEELRHLAANPLVTIGAHTVSHSQLSALESEAQRHEIVGSKQQLESWLDREVAVFSYPYGRRCHYNRESVALCRETGFTKVASNFPGQAHRWTDPFQVPRHLVRNWGADEFGAKLAGFWTR